MFHKLAVFTLFLIATLPTLISADFRQHNMEDIKNAHANCLKHNHPDSETFNKYMNFEFEPAEKNDCYVACLLEQLDMYNPADGFLKHNIMNQITARNPKVLEPAMKSFDQCATQNPRDCDVCCDWVARCFNCFMKKNRDAVLQSFAD